MKKLIRPVHLAILAMLVTACASPPPAPVNYPPPAPRPPPPPVVIAPPVAVPVAPTPVAPPAPVVDTGASERALLVATDAYDRGEFASAVRLLTPMTTDGSLDPTQLLRALKTLAFSQCSTNSVTACRQTFERAFRADASFDLLPAERGHPIWGAQFARARRTVLGR